MSSMSKVMQKIREDGSEPTEAEVQAAQPGTDGSAAPTGQSPGGGDSQATSQGSAVDEASTTGRFVPDGLPVDSDGAPTRRPLGPLSNDIAKWEPKRVDPVVVAFHDRYSAICEQYRSVRARLLTMNSAQAQQVIAVTSSIPEEGKSASTINLGLVMAENGEHRILIADADFRRSSISHMLGIRRSPGLANVLRGEVDLHDALQATPYPNLKILPAGEVRDNAYGELLGGNSTAHALAQFREAFDYAFVDTPPITTVSDVCLLAPHCDGALMVVEMRRTPEPTVQQAVRTLQANNVKLLGCILSRYRDRGSAYYEHYYSAYYGR